ncbi:MAG TPA: NfeD family protein [Nocardioidaceae bacterium]|jgi:membrane protein implicated in regulation of membrane protease activity|nr:NfeD family protein [Nocardioidaceae bacterium]
MEAFGEHLWLVWLGLAILLGVLELFSLSLILLMLSAGAVVGMALALVNLPVGVQVVGAVITSVGMLALVRPNMIARLHSGPELRLGHQALIGRQAIVVSEVSSQAGEVRIDGELWTARPYDETEVIEPGATVDVFEIRGATALVHKVPTLDG